ncbi:MAG: hypothetical protein JSR44_00520 [Spirochaetes bacterium]|nr:hypothetical protein [Spirochaetota bacterium]
MGYSFLNLIICGSIFLSASACRDKSGKISQQPTWLTRVELEDVRKTGVFLSSLQRSDGAIVDTVQNPADSAIAQTGYALRLLVEIDSYTGGFTETISRGRSFLFRHAEPNNLWKYKPFLPADLDDTTAAFASLAGGDAAQGQMSEACARTVLAFQEQGGALRTWLIDERDFQTLGLKIVDFRIAEAHPEVMAYFFHALLSSKLSGFSAAIDSAAQYAGRTQQRDGSWKTVWYRNDLYAVYRVHRFLSQEKYRFQYARNLRAAEAYVIGARLSDGTWGQDQKSCILDTAFALEILRNSPRTIKKDLDQAMHFLLSKRNNAGGWPPEPFFYLDISQRVKTSGKVFIGSTIYSTVIATESLLRYYYSRAVVPQS